MSVSKGEVYNKKLGILGGGQLGRMLAMAAYNMGMQVVIFTDTENSPASYVTRDTIVANYEDYEALQAFANKVDFITLEFENIPTQTLDFLAQHSSFVHPKSSALRIVQDRLQEKRFVNKLGIATTQFEEVHDIEKVTFNYPYILKTLRFGYDGKGQCLIKSSQDRAEIKLPCIAEQIVNFRKEISIIAARDLFGNIESFPIAENIHKNGILRTSSVPADIDHEIEKKAKDIAVKIMQDMDYIGVMTIEFFVTQGGDLLVNEIAPRVHNSGHWSIEACNVSQFEQHVRAVCGLPIKAVKLYLPCIMHNIIGQDIEKIIVMQRIEKWSCMEKRTYGMVVRWDT